MLQEELLKNLNGAIDVAIRQMVEVETLAKGEMNLQDAKLRPESANGSLPGDNREESTLKPEDANKAEEAAKAEATAKAEAAAKGENPFADKDKKEPKGDKNPDAKADDKKDHKEPDGDEDDDDMDDDKAAKLKAKIKKYEDDKAAKAAGAPATMTKTEVDQIADSLKKSVTEGVATLAKSFGDRLAAMESVIQKIAGAPQPRQSVSGLAPLAKTAEDVQPAAAAALQKNDVLNKLWDLQKNNDKRVDSIVIGRVEMGDFSVLAERGINLK